MVVEVYVSTNICAQRNNAGSRPEQKKKGMQKQTHTTCVPLVVGECHAKRIVILLRYFRMRHETAAAYILMQLLRE